MFSILLSDYMSVILFVICYMFVSIFIGGWMAINKLVVLLLLNIC